MFDALMHLLGICPDHHCHLNLFQVVAAGMLTSCSAASMFVRGLFRRRVS